MPETKAKNQALVMLVELDDGTLSIIDANKNVHEVKGAEQLMTQVRTILASDALPALESAPGDGPTAQEQREGEKLEEAFGTLGDRLRAVAEAEYGAPIVDAASTVVNHASKKATGFLRKFSRGSRPRRRRMSRS